MGLYQNWIDAAKLLTTPAESDAYWKEYFELEKKNYEVILENYPKVYEGALFELAKEFDMEPTVFTGFLDGINTSLKESVELEKLEGDTPIKLDIDYEKLYFNMLVAKASWLFELPQWDKILDEEKRAAITKEYRKSGMAVSEKTVGRNDPCPCGSGKKYKKCCGA